MPAILVRSGRERMIQAPFLLVIIAVLVMGTPVVATPIPAAIKGTVVDLNSTGQILTMQADCITHDCVNALACDHQHCREPARGLFQGTIPNDHVFSIMQSGDTIEAVYKRFPITSYADPAPLPHDIHTWFTLARLARNPDTGEWEAMDIFGDPDYIHTPISQGYQVHFEVRPLCQDLYSDFYCEETTFTIVLRRNGSLVGEEALLPGESYEYRGEDGSAFHLTYIRGIWSFIPMKTCPCLNLVIHISPASHGAPPPSFSFFREFRHTRFWQWWPW